MAAGRALPFSALVRAAVPSQHPPVATDDLSDDRASRSETPPSVEAVAPSSDIPPLVSDVPPAPASSTVTDAQLRAFLAHPDIQKRVRAIVAARLHGGAPDALRDDIVQQANLAVLTSKSRPSSMDTASGWLSMVTVRAVARHLRADASRRRWLDVKVDIDDEEGPAGAVATDATETDWLLSRWLAHAVSGSPVDQEVFELIAYKAASGKTYAEVAAEHGTTEHALTLRVARFKAKYLPRYRRRRTGLALAVLTGALTLALLGWLFWRPKPEEAKPPPPRPPVPSAVAPPPVAPPPVPPAPIAPAPVDTASDLKL
jgi:DNA-directed RNA polymerase specialized sigma24 family protein